MEELERDKEKEKREFRSPLVIVFVGLALVLFVVMIITNAVSLYNSDWNFENIYTPNFLFVSIFGSYINILGLYSVLFFILAAILRVLYKKSPRLNRKILNITFSSIAAASIAVVFLIYAL